MRSENKRTEKRKIVGCGIFGTPFLMLYFIVSSVWLD